MASLLQGVYQHRNPKGSHFYQILAQHYQQFLQVYPQRFQSQYEALRSVIPEVIDKYLGCGDLSKGFARIRCDGCHHEYLLAFSCKCRYFCTSCHQKRTLIVEDFLTQQLLANFWDHSPSVPIPQSRSFTNPLYSVKTVSPRRRHCHPDLW